MSSDRDWRKWGKSEPSFGVVTCPETRPIGSQGTSTRRDRSHRRAPIHPLLSTRTPQPSR